MDDWKKYGRARFPKEIVEERPSFLKLKTVKFTLYRNKNNGDISAVKSLSRRPLAFSKG